MTEQGEKAACDILCRMATVRFLVTPTNKPSTEVEQVTSSPPLQALMNRAISGLKRAANMSYHIVPVVAMLFVLIEVTTGAQMLPPLPPGLDPAVVSGKNPPAPPVATIKKPSPPDRLRYTGRRNGWAASSARHIESRIPGIRYLGLQWLS
jgi:hypothetical protein